MPQSPNRIHASNAALRATAERPAAFSALPLLFLCAWLAGVTPAMAQGTACMPKGVEYCPIKIVNMSGEFTADQFQVLAVAQKVDATCQGQTAPDRICPPAYVSFDAMGVGTLVPVAAGMTSLVFAKRLSDFPVDSSGAHVLKMPRHGSGRIYITLGETISTSVIGTAPPFTVSDPNLGSSQDPNYYKIYDKFESSFLPYTKNDPNERNPLYINTTSVDSVSIPLSLMLSGSPAPARPGPVGYVRSRAEIFSVVEARFDDKITPEWQKLIQKFDAKPLRVIAPNKGLKALTDAGADPCAVAGSDPCFDRDYFKAQLQAVWDHYNHGKPANAGNTISIVASEILSDAERNEPTPRTLKYTGFVTDGDCAIETTQPQTPSCGDYAVKRDQQGVTSIKGAFCFRRDPLDTTPHVPPQPEFIPVAMPTTDDMISGAGALCPPNGTARSIIARDLNAMLNRGLLPIAGAIEIDDGDKTEKGFWHTHQPYYTNWPMNAKPNFNLYAQVLHDLSTGGVYAFAFDDVGGSDSTLVDDNADAAILTIQNMTGTTIPSPTAPDTGRYSGNIVLPGGDGFPNQSIQYNGKVLAAGTNEPFDNVPSPINLVWVVGAVEHPLAIHLKTKFISPPPLGNRSYNIALSPPTAGAPRWSIAFPGGPGPSPWPSGNAPKLTLDSRSTGRLDSIVLQRDVVGNDFATVVADWYLWVKTASGAIHYYDSAQWVAANSDDDVRPFQAFALPAASQPNADVTIPKSILAAGANQFTFGVNTTRNHTRKDDGTFFQVSTTYQQQ